MNSDELMALVVDALDDLKGSDIRTLDVHKKSSYTDRLVFATGNSSRQVKALADHVVEKVKEQGITPMGEEGTPESGWILVDLGDVVVHVMLAETRDFYNLEKLWGEDTPVDETLS